MIAEARAGVSVHFTVCRLAYAPRRLPVFVSGSHPVRPIWEDRIGWRPRLPANRFKVQRASDGVEHALG
jgi:hypothetical protein